MNGESTELAGAGARPEEASCDKPGPAWRVVPAGAEWLAGDDPPEGQWVTGGLEEALPRPVPYHELLWRDWQDLYQPCALGAQQMDFTVLSYNILAQDLIEQNPQLYAHCPPDTLRWGYRWHNILQELQHWEADIVCLQEVQEDHYHAHIQPSLTAIGYSCHYKRRTGRKSDGCCTGFRAHRFTFLSESHVEYFRPGVDVLNRDNVGLVLLLQPLPAERVTDGRPPPALCVANTHLLYNPRRGDIKLAQLALLLAEVEKMSASPGGSRCPIILCGDLNAVPSSPLYQLLYNGALSCSGLPAWKVSGQEEFCLSPRTLSSPLWPDFLGLSERCQYDTRRAPRSMDRHTYTRDRLLELRYCDHALRRPHRLTLIKGVTDNTPDPLAGPDHVSQSPRPPLLLQHPLDLRSAYPHFLPEKCRPEVTTLPLGRGHTVDYIFYSAQPLPLSSLSQGLRFYQDGCLRLLGRLSLLCEEDLWAAGGLPNPFCCSDHLCLLVRFSLDLYPPPGSPPPPPAGSAL